MTDAERFFDAILPAEGARCLVVLQPGSKPRQFFHNTNQELAQSALHWDAVLAGSNGAVYHGCASYRPGRRRTAQSVHHVQSLWLDVDCGEGKPYATARMGAEAIKHFCEVVGLPVPLLVRSGAGVHCYWLLDSPLTQGEWQPLADGLKEACRAGSLAADTTRTADLASILRPPGTTHRKGEPIPVVMGPIPERVSASIFKVFAAAPRPRVEPGSTTLAHQLAHMRSPEEVDFDALATNCAQLRLFRDTKGRIPEPQWHAGLGVLAHCEDGDRCGQRWSNGHANYSEAETARKLDRLHQLTGPTTCNAFHKVAPDLCEACPHWEHITTPLDTQRAVQASTMGGASQSIAKLGSLPPDMPPVWGDFSYAADGSLNFRHETQKGGSHLVKVVAFPVRVVSVNTGELKSTVRHYSLQNWQPKKGWVDLDLPVGSIMGTGAVAALANVNIGVHHLQFFQQYVRECVDQLTREGQEAMQFEQFGWKEDDGENRGFLYGNRLYHGGATTTVPLTEDLATRSRLYMQGVRGGSVAGWKRAADALLFGEGAEPIAFATLAGLGATLMRFTERHEGGAIIFLRTRDSGPGKSTSLTGAYTMWVNDKAALGIAHRDTVNSAGVNMGVLCNLPVVYDEFWKSDPTALYEDVMAFTDGKDKARLTKEGTLLQRPQRWQTLLISAANVSMVSTLQSMPGTQAACFRVIEMAVGKAPGGLTTSDGDQLREIMHRNAGHVGDAFLRYLTRPEVLSWALDKLPKLQNELIRRGGFDRPHRFWMRSLAAIGVAAEIAQRAGLMSFDVDRILKWGFDHVHSLKDGNVVTNDSSTFMLTMLGQFVNDHRENIVAAPCAYAQGQRFDLAVHPKRVVARVDADTGAYSIDKSTLRQWLQKRQITLQEFTDDLGSKNLILERNKMLTLAAGTGVPGMQVLCIVIDGGSPILTGKPRLVHSQPEARRG